MKLDNVPLSPKQKDKRYSARNEARNCAIESKSGCDKVKSTEQREIFLKQIIQLATQTGFFSTWMEIFKEDADVKEDLIIAFKGTRREYCD